MGPRDEPEGDVRSWWRRLCDCRRRCVNPLRPSPGAAAMFLAALLLAIVTATSPALAQDNQVGLVTAVDGEAVALRDDGRRALDVVAPFYVADVLETGRGSRVVHLMGDSSERWWVGKEKART